MSDNEVYPTAEVLADDALLDGLGAGEVIADDVLSSQLSAWCHELELATPRLPLRAQPSAAVALPAKRHRRTSRVVAGAATVVVLAAGGGVAAAAVSGPHGPLGGLHRILFGDSSTPNPTVDQVRALLDQASRQILTAQSLGGIATLQRNEIGEILDHAARLLTAHPTAPPALRQRLTALRHALAVLPSLVPTPQQPPSRPTPRPPRTAPQPQPAAPTAPAPTPTTAPPTRTTGQTGDSNGGNGGNDGNDGPDMPPTSNPSSPSDNQDDGTGNNRNDSGDNGSGNSAPGADDGGQGQNASGD